MIAVAGRSGTGKSKFINAVRGLKTTDSDKDLAPVGCTETTSSIRAYKFPKNDKIVLSDLPGLGTPTFKKETYMTDIKVDEYDFFIIMSKDRFCEDDLWLAEQLRNSKKKFYFVRSSVGTDIHNDAFDHPNRKENEVLRQIRNDISLNLETKGFGDIKIFLIDSNTTDLYDFGELTKEFIDGLMEIKQEALVFSLKCLAKEVIEEKRIFLANRIPLTAFRRCLPFYSLTAHKEIEFYKEQFGIDANSTHGLEISKLYQSLISKDVEELDDKNRKTMKSIGDGYYVLSYLLPVVGNVMLYHKLCETFTIILEETAKRALDIHGRLCAHLETLKSD